MTYALVLIACLAGNTGACREERVALPAITNPTACYLGAQFTLRDWLSTHPDRRLIDAHCEAAETATR